LAYPFMSTAPGVIGKLSRVAIADANAAIQALSPIEPDLAAMTKDLESLPVDSFALDSCMSAWRGLYLSIYQLPKRIVLVGSIDNAPELAGLGEDTAGLLIIETDVQIVSTAELLPRGIQWRSLAEFGAKIDSEDRVRLVTALVNGLRPSALLVMGSRAGWEMLAQHGAPIRRSTDLFATTAASPELSATKLLTHYLGSCIPVLSQLYGSDEKALYHVADLFGLTEDERHKLRTLRDWRGTQGFLSSLGAEQ
jgi:hypothetical protein